MWVTRRVLPYVIVGLPAAPIGIVLYVWLVREIGPQGAFGQWIIAFASALVAVGVVLGAGVAAALVRIALFPIRYPPTPEEIVARELPPIVPDSYPQFMPRIETLIAQLILSRSSSPDERRTREASAQRIAKNAADEKDPAFQAYSLLPTLVRKK